MHVGEAFEDMLQERAAGDTLYTMKKYSHTGSSHREGFVPVVLGVCQGSCNYHCRYVYEYVTVCRVVVRVSLNDKEA